VQTLLHCGDICGPTVVEALNGFSVYFAQGNMDRVESLGIAVEALQGPGRLARCHQLSLGGRLCALLHGDEDRLLRRLIRSGQYDYVFHGHTHRKSHRRRGKTQIINPGALGGRGRDQRTVCILDLETGETDFPQVTKQR
jgi:putative phosphoesterase